MYKIFIRPVLFLLSPETVHHFIVLLIRVLHKMPGIPFLFRSVYCLDDPDFEKEVFGINFKNPVGLAAGFDKNASFFKEFRSFGFGFIEIGTVTPKAQPGNSRPRSFRLPKDKALINRMGFNNMGVDSAVENLRNRPDNYIIGGNIGKNTSTPNNLAVDDYEYCFQQLYDYVDYFVINVSCPNISNMSELQDQDMLSDILDRIVYIRNQKPVKKPVLLKISPDLNQNQVDETIKLIQSKGIDGIVATNTTISRNNLITADDKVKSIGQGGLSGRPLKDMSTEMIRYIKMKSDGRIPVIGAGGIMTVKDAREKLDAGADLIQIYTGFVYEGPGFVRRILRYIRERRDLIVVEK